MKNYLIAGTLLSLLLSCAGTTEDASLSNPGNSKNCSDFSNYSQAKSWFDKYYPSFGDVAKLDRDKDGIPCESLLTTSPPTTRATPTTSKSSTCSPSRANSLVEEVNTLTDDYTEMVYPAEGSDVSAFYDEKDKRLIHLDGKVKEWGKCLDFAPASIIAYQVAYAEWIDASMGLSKAERSCFLGSVSDLPSCVDLIYERTAGISWLNAMDDLFYTFQESQADSLNFYE